MIRRSCIDFYERLVFLWCHFLTFSPQPIRCEDRMLGSKDRSSDEYPLTFIGQECETSRNGQATRSLFGSWARTRHASVPDKQANTFTTLELWHKATAPPLPQHTHFLNQHTQP